MSTIKISVFFLEAFWRYTRLGSGRSLEHLLACQSSIIISTTHGFLEPCGQRCQRRPSCCFGHSQAESSASEKAFTIAPAPAATRSFPPAARPEANLFVRLTHSDLPLISRSISRCALFQLVLPFLTSRTNFPHLPRPNFVLTFIRPPRHQPANFASFFTPLWMNKLDLKDYLYHLYGVEALYIRSYIAHGRVIRDSGSGRLVRTSQKKKMTIEMKTGDNFVWPDVPEDLEPWNKRVEQALEKEKEAQKEGRSQQGQELGRVGDEARTSLREKARALLEGKVKWRPGWQEHGVGMGPLGAEAKPGASL